MDKVSIRFGSVPTTKIPRGHRRVQNQSPVHSDDRVDISPERVKGKAHRHGGWRSALFCALASLPLVGLAAACGKAEPNPAPAPVVTESTTVVTTLAPPEQTTVVVSTTVPSTVAVTTTCGCQSPNSQKSPDTACL